MIFYLIPEGAGQPEQLEATQDNARAACRFRGLASSAFKPHEVPTDKAGLMAYVNKLMLDRYADRLNAEPVATVSTPAGAAVVVTAAPKLTRAPPSEEAICLAISDLSGVPLGHVALEVAARYQALANGKAA